MNQQTITQLNQLNQDFYQQTATDFSNTRQKAWSGWIQVAQIVKNDLACLKSDPSSASVLDVGCGNGRFGAFLKQEFPLANLNYYGVDSSDELLKLAQEKLATIYSEQALHLIEVDLLHDFDPIEADLICLFGVMHHLPSFELRRHILTTLAKQLKPGGILVFTAWQFDRLPNLMNRQLEPVSVGLDPAELEPNDYLLTWERGSSATRYCHLLQEPELGELITALDLELLADFSADGADAQLNRYLVLQAP